MSVPSAGPGSGWSWAGSGNWAARTRSIARRRAIVVIQARTLPRPAWEQYLAADDEALKNIDAWDRKMLHRQIKVSKRVFLEVYA